MSACAYSVFSLQAPTCNQAQDIMQPARRTYHLAGERGSESISEIFITVSISHALFTLCQSDGEKERQVEG